MTAEMVHRIERSSASSQISMYANDSGAAAMEVGAHIARDGGKRPIPFLTDAYLDREISRNRID
jgi:hypothetical protein